MTAFALLLFPKTLEHYSVFLLPSLLLLWKEPQWLIGGSKSVIPVIVAEYGLVSYAYGSVNFLALVLNWLVLALISFLAIRKNGATISRPVQSAPAD